MSGDNKDIYTTKKPERVCPVCGEQVIKMVRMGQLSYACSKHWGPWDEAVKKAARDAAAADIGSFLREMGH